MVTHRISKSRKTTSAKISVSSLNQVVQSDFLPDLLGDYILLLPSFKPNFPRPYLHSNFHFMVSLFVAFWLLPPQPCHSKESRMDAWDQRSLKLWQKVSNEEWKAVSLHDTKKGFQWTPSYTTSATKPRDLQFWEGFSLKLQKLVFPEMTMTHIFHRSKGIIFLFNFKVIVLEKSHDEIILGHDITTMPILLSKCTTQTLQWQYRTMYT